MEMNWYDDPICIEKIEIIISDINDKEIIKIYEWYNECDYEVESGQAVKWVYDNVLNKCTTYKPDVWVHDVKTRVLKYKIGGMDK